MHAIDGPTIELRITLVKQMVEGGVEPGCREWLKTWAAELDVQISTAKAYPRSIAKFQKDALTFATVDEETAGSMFYVLPKRKGGNK